MNDYKDQDLKSSIMSFGVLVCIIVAIIINVVIN